MSKRRDFLKTTSLATTALLFSKPLQSIAGITNNSFLRKTFNTVTIFHTNDLHGAISPFIAGNKSGLGGLENVQNLLKEQGASDLLLDAGDFLNDKASYEEHKNFIVIMNNTGYDAVTIGNNELSKGQDYLASLIPLMNFKPVNCNYEFTDPVLKDKVLPYHIIKYGQFKIGITGVGHDLAHIDSQIRYHHPYKKANEVATYLKQQLNCDMVICLSHLGFKQDGSKPDNYKFAVASENIDLIISGHTNEIMNSQRVLRNNEKQQVIISHAGWGGLMMGKLSFTFDENRRQHFFDSKNYIPGFPTDHSIYDQYRKLIA